MTATARDWEELLRGPRSYSVQAPTERQAVFLASTAREALFGGAAGGGKSSALLMAALEHVHVPGYAALVLRRTYADLALPGAIMARSHEWLAGTDAQWNGTDKRWTFPSGATLSFGYLDTDRDRFRYQGAELQCLCFDEATQFPEAWYRYLLSRLRKPSTGELARVPLRSRLATNPGGVGHEWVRRRFVESTDPERVFVPSLLSDNPHLDQAAYRAQLDLLDAHTRRQLLEGEWVNDPGGLVYPFDEARNVADAAPPLTQYVLGIDFGVVDATAFTVLGWAAHDPTVWIVESYGRSGMSPSDAADEVRALMGRYTFERIVGDVGGLGKAFAEEMRSRHSLPIEAAEKHNKRGYQSLMVGDLERGRIRVIRATCTQLIDEWRELPWTEDRQREADGFENHCSDSALYGWRAAHAFLETPKAAAPKPGSREAELAAFEERRKRATEDREREFWQRASGEGEWWRR